MTQASPSVLLYEQAAVLVNDLLTAYKSGSAQTVQEVSEKLREVLTQYQKSAGSPIMRFEPLSHGEPPLSAKMNRFWEAARHDVNILQNQVDLLRASAVTTHNIIATELGKARTLNSKANNRLNTLQLYSKSTDPSILVFNENFGGTDFIDLDSTPAGERATVLEGAFLSLGRQGGMVNLSESATITINSETSTGFLGNNQEIEDPALALVNPVTNEPQYRFVGETMRAAEITDVLDGEPDTWFEYEHCFVSEANRLSAGNFNFEYERTTSTGRSEADWAQGPKRGKLSLDLRIDLGATKIMNYLSYVPHGLKNNDNFPVYVRHIQTSVDGTEWDEVTPQGVWVGTASNLQTARVGANVQLGTAIWSFQEREVRYIRILLEQPNSVDRPIGHLYYVNKITGVRAEGPLPNAADPTAAYNPQNSTTGDLLQKREFFWGKRWAIGIRDILAQQVAYAARSSMVSEPIRAGGLIDRVSIDADIYVPPEFPDTASYVRFYVSPNDGTSWYPISRVTDDYLGLPEVIVFNDPTPAAFQETGVQYVSTPDPVTAVRVKIELERPAQYTSSTPLVRSYSLRGKKRL